MKEETVAALNRINRRFYSDLADDFSSTRGRAWSGWQRLLPLLEAQATGRQRDDALRILDVGCGNGRFQRFVAENHRGKTAYIGVDSSTALLREASQSGISEARWLHLDLTEEEALATLVEESFDFIAVLALLHHVPSFARRRQLVASLIGLLAEQGALVLSHWQFGASSRFDRRAVSWNDYRAGAGEPIDVSDLEPGDRLLAWGPVDDDGLPRSLRYCHHTDPAEAERLTAGLDLERIDSFRADGRGGDLNLYQIFGRRRSP